MKRKISIFICYAHRNSKLATEFSERLREYILSSKNFEYEIWRDVELKAGEDWNALIRSNLESSTCGILLLSPSFLNSSYINNVELPELTKSNRIVIPVALTKFNLDIHDLHGLDRYQIYWLQSKGLSEPRDYSSLKRDFRKDEFIDGIVIQMEKRLLERQ